MSIKKFPPINFDEVAGAVIAHQFVTVGRINYPLMTGVIHPDFEGLARGGQEGLRSTHALVLGVVQKVWGIDFFRLRFFSFVIWLSIAVLLFFLVRNQFSTAHALAAAVLWFFSLDGFLASHLIRPDMLLGFTLMAILCLLLMKDRMGLVVWLIAGVLSGLSLGFHFNGAALIAGLVLLAFFETGDVRLKRDSILLLLLGVAVGMGIWLFMADLETCILGQHSYVAQLYSAKSGQWLRRLAPWALLADSAMAFIRPASFYVSESMIHPLLWLQGGVCQFMALALSAVWVFHRTQKEAPIRFFFWSFLFMFFAIGFGRFRDELVYNVPTTLLGVPLVAWVLVDSWTSVDRFWKGRTSPEDRRSALAFLVLMALLGASFFCVFKASLLFYFLVISVILVLDGASDSFVLGVIGGLLFLLFSLRVQAKPSMDLLNGEVMRTLSSYSGVGMLSIGVMAMVSLKLLMRRVPSLSQTGRAPSASLLLLLLVAGCGVVSATNTAAHVIRNSSRTPSIDETWDRAKSFVSDSDKKILGPYLFWMIYQDRFRDVNALVLDYFYSGQKRPWECIERYKPDVVIVDDDIRRRFLVEAGPGTKTRVLLPVETIIKVPFVQIGSIPANPHHSQLDFYRLDWAAGGR